MVREGRRNVIQAFFTGIAPVEKVDCNIWADQNIVLTSESSAEPGQWETSRTPHLIEPLQLLSPTNICKEVVVAKGVQLGFTASGLICMLTYVGIDPSPIMYVMPTMEIAEDFSKDRLQPMIDNCAQLSKKIKPAHIRDSGNTITRKRYPGGVIVLAGANSAATLRSKAIRVLILDEVDAYPLNLDKEGSPISLAEKRTATYGDRKKIFKLSTPTNEHTSVIWKEYLSTDQRKLFVPCPICGAYQELLFEGLKWVDGQPETAVYECAHCHKDIEEHHKPTFLCSGEWRSTVPEKRNDYKAGFHINSLYSPYGWMKWSDIATEYERAIRAYTLGDPNLYQVFVNTILGMPYAESGDKPGWEMLYDRREDYRRNKPTNDVLIITAGIDVQGDRIECEIVGWGKNRESWSLDYRVLEGNIAEPKLQSKIAAILNETWKRPDGLEIPLHFCCIDSSDQTSLVYNFCATQLPTKIAPIKGLDKQRRIFSNGAAANKTPAGKDAGAVKYYMIGTDMLKEELYTRLKLRKSEDGKAPPGYCHFPEYSDHYFKGITGEELKTKYVNGRPKVYWDNVYRRNEPMDCRNYARVAQAMTGVDSYGDEVLEDLNNSYKKTTLQLDDEIENSYVPGGGSLWGS